MNTQTQKVPWSGNEPDTKFTKSLHRQTIYVHDANERLRWESCLMQLGVEVKWKNTDPLLCVYTHIQENTVAHCPEGQSSISCFQSCFLIHFPIVSPRGKTFYSLITDEDISHPHFFLFTLNIVFPVFCARFWLRWPTYPFLHFPVVLSSGLMKIKFSWQEAKGSH